MKIKWKLLISQLVIWLIVEVVLNFLGLDNLADYSEFIQKRNPQVTFSMTYVLLKV